MHITVTEEVFKWGGWADWSIESQVAGTGGTAKFQVDSLYQFEVMNYQTWKNGCVWKTPFHKSGHILVYFEDFNLIQW